MGCIEMDGFEKELDRCKKISAQKTKISKILEEEIDLLKKEIAERSAAKNEPAPTGTGKKVIDEVVLDLKSRSDMGEKKYGTPLRTFNGRNAMMDLYQELLDSVMYAKQVLMEMEDK